MNAAIASRDEPSYIPVGLYGIRFTLKTFGSSSAASSLRLLGRVVDAGEHDVLDEDLPAAQLDVATALGEDVSERVAVVHRHQLGAQARIGGVEREREPDRLLDLVDEARQAGHPADGGDRRPPVRDPEVGQPPRRREHVVVVEERLAHAHEDEVVDRLDAPEVERLVEDLRRASDCGRTRIAPVAQNVQVSGQPDCDETQTERRPSR